MVKDIRASMMFLLLRDGKISGEYCKEVSRWVKRRSESTVMRIGCRVKIEQPVRTYRTRQRSAGGVLERDR